MRRVRYARLSRVAGLSRGLALASAGRDERQPAASPVPSAQDELIVRPAPPALDDLETDANQRRTARRLVQRPRRHLGVRRRGPRRPAFRSVRTQ